MRGSLSSGAMAAAGRVTVSFVTRAATALPRARATHSGSPAGAGLPGRPQLCLLAHGQEMISIHLRCLSAIDPTKLAVDVRRHCALEILTGPALRKVLDRARPVRRDPRLPIGERGEARAHPRL